MTTIFGLGKQFSTQSSPIIHFIDSSLAGPCLLAPELHLSQLETARNVTWLSEVRAA